MGYVKIIISNNDNNIESKINCYSVINNNITFIVI